MCLRGALGAPHWCLRGALEASCGYHRGALEVPGYNSVVSELTGERGQAEQSSEAPLFRGALDVPQS